ncbi:MAG: anhydro-N-acetylmuramic acid kinase [Pseudomonadota bacterium]
MLYAGLMSGTSRDAIDAVIVDLDEHSIDVVCSLSRPYAPPLRAELDQLISSPETVALANLGELHARVGDAFAEAAQRVIEAAGASPGDIRAIGSHGQTVHHGPDATYPYSMQIGDAARIAQTTGVATVADFRSADIAAGGQGAPLVPPFHRWLFGEPGRTTAVVNIGGIANATIVTDETLLGFDTGPGNTLLDAWTRIHRDQPFDRDGVWASTGKVEPDMLATMLSDPYFDRPPPKSTGFEYFNRQWIESFESSVPDNTQATLLALTVQSIATAIRPYAPDDVLVCGGGVHNSALMASLRDEFGKAVSSTAERGLDPDLVEASAFAWLASRRLASLPGNAPTVTGASREVPLGAVYLP